MNRLRLEKDRGIEDNITKNISNLSRLNNENEPIKDRIIRDIRNLLELENVENNYK